jgi:nucleoside-diphosphate-sugar epimerase
MKNILIIGCGFLGFKAGEVLRKAGHKITGATRSKSKLFELKNYLGNSVLWSPENYFSAFQGQDIILFTAAPDNPAFYKETYLNNASVIANALSINPTIKQVIYTSSTSIYGEHQGKPVDENTACTPLNPQTQILKETEELLSKFPQTCILRLGELIGQDRTLEERLRAQRGVPFPGNGEMITNLSPLSDVIRAISFAIDKPLFGVYNVCSDMHATRKELYQHLASARNIPEIKWDPSKTSLHSGNKTILNGKIKKAGFQFEARPWEGILNGLEMATI